MRVFNVQGFYVIVPNHTKETRHSNERMSLFGV